MRERYRRAEGSAHGGQTCPFEKFTPAGFRPGFVGPTAKYQSVCAFRVILIYFKKAALRFFHCKTPHALTAAYINLTITRFNHNLEKDSWLLLIPPKSRP
jgi:hypothetical protein